MFHSTRTYRKANGARCKQFLFRLRGLHLERLEPRMVLSTTLAAKTDPIYEHNSGSGRVSRLVVGDPNSSPPATVAGFVDPNVPDSPYAGVVSITLNGNQHCTGTLFSPVHVVTAAHCLDGDGNGQIEVSLQALAVNFNHNNPQNNALGAVRLSALSLDLHPDWGRGSQQGQGTGDDDIAVITLSGPAPLAVPIYPIDFAPFTTNQEIILVGYGRRGDISSGAPVGSGNAYVKLVGQNVATSVNPNPTTLTVNPFDDDTGTQFRRERWQADFDGPTLATDSLSDGGTLGNNVEVGIAPGDSGGPSFRWNDLNQNSSIEQGELVLWGINTFGGCSRVGSSRLTRLPDCYW